VREKREVFHGRIFSVTLDRLAFEEGGEVTMEVVRHGGAAAIVPFTENGQVILIRQFRYSVLRSLWEVPAGKLDPGEDSRSCAMREMQEETGYRAESLEKIGSILTTPGFSDERIDIFVARGLTKSERSLDPDEFIEVVPVPFAAALEMIERGDIEDSKTVAALLLAARRFSWA
jgi:ADP-ribose pyrophosphatase